MMEFISDTEKLPLDNRLAGVAFEVPTFQIFSILFNRKN